MINRLAIASRIWFPVLLAGLAAGLSLAVLNQSSAARAAEAAVPSPGLRIVHSDEDRLVVELDVPAFELQAAEAAQENFQRVVVDGALALDVPGKPELPKFSALLGIPAQGGVSVRVLEDSAETVPGRYRLLPSAAPAPPAGDLQAGTMQRVPDGAAYASAELYPAAVARVAETAWLRDQRLARIEIYPFQYLAAAGALRWHRHLQIEVKFDGGSAPRRLAAPAAAGPFEQTLRDNLLNYAVARHWRSSTAAPRAASLSSTSTAPRYKIVVDQDGLYRVTYNDLLAAGLVMTSFDPRHLHLTNQGLDAALEVVGENDGQFGPGDYLLFYGQRLRGDVLASRHTAEANDWISLHGWQPQFNARMVEKYTDDNVYWLDVGTTAGLRMSLLDGTPASASPAEYYTATIHAEQSNEWRTLTYSSEDTWFWQKIPAYIASTVAYTTDLTAVAAVPVSATVRAELAPLAYGAPLYPAARVQFWLNQPDNLLADVILSSTARLKLNAALSPAALLAGRNTLTLTVPASPTSNLELYFDWFEIEYARRFAADGNQLTFADNRSGARRYAIGNFTTDTLHVLNVSNPWRPQRVVSSSITSAAGSTTATFQITASVPVTYFVTGADQMQSPKQISRYAPPDLGSSNGADYVIITHRDFITPLQTLAAHRAAEGLRVKLIDVDDLYNQFTDGLYHPIAIKSFLKYAYANWQPPAPAYVLLVGDGHWNFKNFNPAKYGSPTPVFMPPNLGWVDPWQGEVDTANELVEIVGNDPLPDMLVGRLPVNTAAEASVVVNKIIDYEAQARFLPYRQRMMFVADNTPDASGDFAQMSDDLIRDVLPGEYAADRVYADNYDCPPGINPCPQVSYAITSTLNQTGALFVNYIGHAGINFWGNESLLVNAHVPTLDNLDRLPIILSMTCLDGYGIYPGRSSLMEDMLRAAQGGSVASFSPTGLGLATGHDVLERGLLKAVFQQGASRLGAAALAGKVALYATGQDFDLIDTYTVFGDPALRLPIGQNNPVYLPLVQR